MLKICIFLLLASGLCATQMPQVTIELSAEIDGFINGNTTEQIDKIGRALNYSPNVQYKTSEHPRKIEEILTNISTVLSKVCAQSNVLKCDISQIGMYIVFEEPRDRIWKKKDFESSTIDMFGGSKHEFKLCAIIINVPERTGKKALQSIFQLLEPIKSSGFELGYHGLDASSRYELDPNKLKETFTILDHIFIPIETSWLVTLPESFLIFKDYFADSEKLVAKIKNIFDDGRHPNIHLEVQFYSEEFSDPPPSQAKFKTQYTKMFLKFVNQLVEDTKLNFVISGIIIPTGCTRSDVVMETVVGKDVFPIPKLYSQIPPFLTSPEKPLPFPTVIMSDMNVEDWVNGASMVANQTNKTDSNAQLINVLVEMIMWENPGDRSMLDLLASNQSVPNSVGVQVKTLIFNQEKLEMITNNSLVHSFHETGIELAIEMKLGLLKNYKSSNNPFETVSENVVVDVFLLKFYISFEIYLGLFNENIPDLYKREIQSPLTRVYEDWKKYQQVYPNRTIIIDLSEANTNYEIYDAPFCKGRAYCNTCYTKVRKLYEAIFTWAKVHEVPIIKRNLFWYRTSMGWYEYVGVKGEVVVSRNQPLRILNEQNACIHQTESVPGEGIQFNPNMSGITVNGRFKNVQNESLNPDELGLMTAFAIKKFNLVEILLEQDAECNAVTNVGKALEKLKPHHFQNGTQTRLFFDFPLQPVNEMPLITQLNCYKNLTTTVSNALNEKTTLSGVHISNWKAMENFTEDLTQTNKSLNISLGIAVENCNNLRREVKRCDAPLGQVDYILCRIEYFEASNSNREQMSKQLDNVLYISNIFRKLCPHLQVYFRLTARIRKNNKERTIVRIPSADSEFIKFLSDWSQFTVKYNIPIFLTETVDHTNTESGSNGWWYVSNWTDLTNPKVYFDKEAELLNKPTWRPTFLQLIPNIADIPIQTAVVKGFVLIAIAAISAITVVVVAALKFWGHKRKILTQEQIRAILDGDNSHFSKDLIPLREMEADVIYDSTYEISKDPKIYSTLGEVKLGSGHFGDVVKAQVGDDWVAVKKPNKSCTRQGLISMLEEVKIMCYIGTHEHVLRFIGCSTKHASIGVIYIATELCENGCLQKYLIDLEPRVKRNENRNLHLYQLNQFAFEIASGMEYITGKRIIHSDLATRNVLLDSNMTCKIGDFGLSRKLYINDLYKKQGNDPMPWRWLAVESLKRREYSSASDVWSYGITIWEIFSFGQLPYSEITSASGFADLIQNGLRLNNPHFLPQTTFKTVSECWSLEISERPTFTQLKEFFREILGQVYTEI